VGRDKGSLTEQQTKGTGTTTIQIRGKHNTNRTTQRATLNDSRAVTAPQLEPSMTAHGMEYPALFGQVGSAPPDCVPSWILVKINPFMAETRTAQKQS